MKTKALSLILLIAVMISALTFPIDAVKAYETNEFGNEVQPFDPNPGIAKTGVLDFSWLNEAPAGNHGHVLVEGDHFVFEDGTPIKFFGVVLGFGAAMPAKSVAEAYAAELASSGVNFIRLHAIDGWGGVFSFAEENRSALNETNIDRMDYLIYCLKQKGIYVHLDTNAYTVFREEDGFTEKEAASIDNAASLYDERACELKKQATVALLEHYNPYTKMKYCEDPVIACVQFANETTVFWQASGPDAAGYATFSHVLKERFNEWLYEKYKTTENWRAAWTSADGDCACRTNESIEERNIAIVPYSSAWGCEPLVAYFNNPRSLSSSPRHADYMQFLIDMASADFNDLYERIRATGYKSAIANSNMSEGYAALTVDSLGDITEKNTYFNNGSAYYVPAFFTDYGMDMSAIVPNHSNHTLRSLAQCVISDRPFVVTEWNITSVTLFKGDGLYQMAAYGALNGWDGLCMFNYTFEGNDLYFFDLKQFSDFFGTNVDPANYAVMGVCAMIFRTGIVSEAKNKVEIGVTKQDALATNSDYRTYSDVIPFVSSFSIRIMDDDTYDGNADLVIPCGNTASGDYTSAEHLIMNCENPFCDAYNYVKGRKSWLKFHTEPNSTKVTFGKLTFEVGETAAVCVNPNDNGGIFSTSDFATVYTELCRELGIYSENVGWSEDKIVSDTEEITYYINSHFEISTESVQIFAGTTDTTEKGNNFGECKLITANDRAAISVISMNTERNIRYSDHLLISAIGRTAQTDMVWEDNNGNGMLLSSFGTAPILYEDIKGTLTIPSKAENITVYALDELGNRVEEVTTDKVDGGFEIEIAKYLKYEVVADDVNPTYGDINGDGIVKGSDSTLLLKYLSGWDVKIAEYNSDLNGDGTVKGSDATKLLKYLAGWFVMLG